MNSLDSSSLACFAWSLKLQKLLKQVSAWYEDALGGTAPSEASLHSVLRLLLRGAGDLVCRY